MLRVLLSTSVVLSAVTALPTTVQANDIIDFLRAISAPPRHHHDYHPTALHPVSQRYVYDSRVRGNSYRTIERHRVSSRRSARPIAINRPGMSFTVSLGNSSLQPVPRVPVLPEPPVPGSFDHLPHQIGDIVTCPVPIAGCVRVKDEDEIAPGAVPVVVAVRDPHLGRFRTCVEQLVYVEVLVPPCPLQKLRVSPCRTKIRMDYGKYEVDIVSRRGVIEIDYDD